MKCISYGGDKCEAALPSISLDSGTFAPNILKLLGSGKMIIERSISFKGRQFDIMIKSLKPDKEENICERRDCAEGKENNTQMMESDCKVDLTCKLLVLDPSKPEHEAATKLQKVYKSFRTRRKLADCAVLAEQSWWKLMDFAELKQSSISFFDIEKHETAISRWARARIRAAKVGKGLSKNDKAQKLALQHWLEAIDPRHRYGHSLHLYYIKWLHSQSKQPFFYWLDIGEGKEVNLVEKCPRSKLSQQCVEYLGPAERKAYEIDLQDGKFFFKQTGKLLHTTGEDSNAKWIFVLSTSKVLYVGKKKKGRFHHSSFLAGGATIAAGRLVVENGILKAAWPHSGHYLPTEENFNDFLSFLRENNVDLTDVKMGQADEEEGTFGKQRSSHHLRTSSSEVEFTKTLNEINTQEIEDLLQEENGSAEQQPIPNQVEPFERVYSEKLAGKPPIDDGYESAEGEEEALASRDDFLTRKQVLLDEEAKVPQESILKRINSKKETKSYQLGKQLSSRWTTGAGPRIGCVRDYPSELQFRALEQVNLSPRTLTSS